MNITNFYAVIPKQWAYTYTQCRTWDEFTSWADNCPMPLFSFEGIATDDIFPLYGYDMIRVTNTEEAKYIIKKFYSV